MDTRIHYKLFKINIGQKYKGYYNFFIFVIELIYLFDCSLELNLYSLILIYLFILINVMFKG